MEIFLLIIIIVILFTIKNNIDAKFINIENHVSDLHTLIEALKKEIQRKNVLPYEEVKSFKEEKTTTRCTSSPAAAMSAR